jgi:hypothetical protein
VQTRAARTPSAGLTPAPGDEPRTATADAQRDAARARAAAATTDSTTGVPHARQQLMGVPLRAPHEAVSARMRVGEAEAVFLTELGTTAEAEALRPRGVSLPRLVAPAVSRTRRRIGRREMTSSGCAGLSGCVLREVLAVEDNLARSSKVAGGIAKGRPGAKQVKSPTCDC